MMYKDQYGRYDDNTEMERFDENGDLNDNGNIVMINNYSLLQSEPRRMPNFFMVRPADEE